MVFNLEIIKALIFILIYLIATTKHTKEYLQIQKSDITITYCEFNPTIKHQSNLIISKYKIKDPNYFAHSNNYLYVHEMHKSYYDYNYCYKNNLYHNDFRFVYVCVFIVKELNSYTREWLRNNLKASPSLYNIIYIYNDEINNHNKKLFPFVEYGCTVVIYGIKPYYRYQVDRCVILSNRELNYKVDFKCNQSNLFLKFYMDKYKLVCLLKNNNKIIDKFELNSNLDKFFKKEDLAALHQPALFEYYPDKINMNDMKWKWDGIPPVHKIALQWYDDVFDNWYDLILIKLKTVVDTKKINLNKLTLPTNFMYALYLYHRNVKKITDDNIINEIIQDMHLPMKKIIK